MGTKAHSWQLSIFGPLRHYSSEGSSALSSHICSIYYHFSLLYHLNSLEWEKKLEVHHISLHNSSENWNIFRQNYSRFPLWACWSFSPCPDEACGLWLTSCCIPQNVLEKKRKKNRFHLHCPPWTTAVLLLSGRHCRNLISTNRLLNVQKS